MVKYTISKKEKNYVHKGNTVNLGTMGDFWQCAIIAELLCILNYYIICVEEWGT